MMVALAPAVLLAVVGLVLAVTYARRLRAAEGELVALRKSQAEEAALAAERARGLADLAQRNQFLADQAQTLGAKAAGLAATLEQERGQAAQMRDDREQLAQRFKQLADEMLLRHGETFARQNRTQIDTTLAPLREKLAEFQQNLQAAHTESVTGRALLKAQIERLSEDSAKVRTEAENLATALRGEAQMRGAWGEMILDSILQKSGLVKGEGYFTQQSHVTPDGRRLLADAVVPLPSGQSLVIDSKVSLVAFESYVNAAAEDARAECLKAHVGALRAQINDLSGKAYHAVVPGSPDFVIMFVPIEAALAAAVQADGGLISFATECRVALATPTTLIIALRTAANVWQVEKRNRNAEQIAIRGGLLYDKLAAFAGDMLALGNRLNQARDSYDDAMKKLQTGSGNLLRQAEQLKGMGARTTKSLPPALRDAAAEEEPVEAG